jgi:hypothetical protein
MGKHDELLEQGPREAPEPETAEQHSQKLGLKTAGGVVAGGGVAAAKVGALGGLGKFFLWAALWNGLLRGFQHGGWIALVVVAAVVAAWLIHRRRVA